MNKFEIRELNDRETWNNFLESQKPSSDNVPKVTFIQSFEWGEFQKSLGKEIVRFALYKDSTLVGVCAGTIIRAKRGKYLYFRNGPVLDWSDKALVTFTISSLKLYAQNQGLWFIRISPLVEKASKEEVVIKQFNFKDCPMNDVEALDTWVMPLNAGEEDLYKLLAKKTRYAIKQGYSKENLKTVISTDVKDIDIFYKILTDTVKRHNWNAYSKSYIQKEFEAFVANNRATLVLVKHENEFIAGGIFIHFASQSFYHYGASLTKYNKLSGMYVMIWEAVREAIKRNHSHFNFWGIAPENKINHPWTGLTNFKKKFTGHEQRWMISKDIPVSSKYYLTHFFEKFDAWRKGY